jgi:hypothetical protein
LRETIFLNRKGRQDPQGIWVIQSINNSWRSFAFSLRPLREPFFLNRKGRKGTQGNWVVR